MGQLEGKVAIVTGGARGIGAGIARVMAREGAHVAILDLDGEQAAATAGELATDSIGMACDVILEAPLTERCGGLWRGSGGWTSS